MIIYFPQVGRMITGHWAICTTYLQYFGSDSPESGSESRLFFQSGFAEAGFNRP